MRPSSSPSNDVVFHEQFDYIRRHVIHAVGPVYSSKDKEQKAEQLASCYRTSLEIAVENELRHVVSRDPGQISAACFESGSIIQAFPSISTGVYSYPIVDATRIALNSVRTFLDSEAGTKVRTTFNSATRFRK